MIIDLNRLTKDQNIYFDKLFNESKSEYIELVENIYEKSDKSIYFLLLSTTSRDLNLNDKEYVINELSPECQSCLVYMQEIEAEINELNKQLTKQQIAKQGFEGLLGQYIKAQEDAVNEAQEEADSNEKPAN